jgi:predicted PurR-regulated permease PerM
MSGIFKWAYDAKWLIFGLALLLILLWVAWPFVSVIVYSIFLYYIAKPIKRRLRPHVKNDSLLVGLCLFLLVLPLIIIIGYTLLVAVSQLNAVISGLGLQTLPKGPLLNMSSIVSRTHENLTIENIMSGNVSAIIPSNWYQALSGYSGSIFNVQQFVFATGMTIADILFKLFLMIIIAFYLLRDDERLISWFMSTFYVLAHEHNDLLLKYVQAVDEDLEKIFFGNILSIVFFAIVAAIVFNFLNVFAPVSMRIPSPILLGMLCGISALVPVVGMYLVTVPLFIFIIIESLVAGEFFSNLPYFIVMVAVVAIFVQTLPEFILRPFMSRGKVNTGLLMFAYILGPIVFGIAGLFIGAIVLVLLTHYFTIVVPSITKRPA